MSNKTYLFAVAALAVLAMGAPSYAATPGAPVITVETQDMPGGHMALKSSHDTIPAGEVTFIASNVSIQGKDHEVLMIKSDLEPKDLPKTADGKAIDEKKLEGIVELGDIGPGTSNETKVTLEPGAYLLFCNLPGHTGAGMWSRLNVTEKTASLDSPTMATESGAAASMEGTSEGTLESAPEGKKHHKSKHGAKSDHDGDND